MLKSLDVLIGLAVVMLVVSMGVTLLTQAWVSVTQSRGKHLRRGLADLLRYTGLDSEAASRVAGELLMHPVVRGSVRRMGSVIKREELIMLLLEKAGIETGQPAAATAAAGAESGSTGRGSPTPGAPGGVAGLLAKLGVTEPGKTLDRIRMIALELERTRPELSNAARHNMAILEAAQSQFVASIHSWFDQTMDRVSERFTFSTRQVTFISASIVAIALQLDTAALVNRLALDDNVRRALVERAQQFEPPPDTKRSLQEQLQETRRTFREIAAADVIWVPGSAAEWRNHWAEVNLGGLLVSILLLSLGAPFWYSSLSRLLQLRSVLARKEDNDRAERQTITGT